MFKPFTILSMLIVAGAVMAAPGQSVKFKGYVIDNACSGRANGPDGLAKVKNHTIKCALMPDCSKSGYALFTDGKLYKFDEAGNQQVMSLLKKTKVDKGMAVSVEGTLDGETLHATKISEDK
jgi:hypothetical protein